MSKLRTTNIFMMQSYPIRTALIDEKGNILKVYRSQTDAGVSNDCDISAISKLCRGVYPQGHTKGKRFKKITNKEFKELKEDWQ